MEDYAYILDFLPHGKSDDKRIRKEPLALALGDNEFKLFELVVKPNVTPTVGEKVYIGKELEKRDQILNVKRRIHYTELTANAQSELPFVIETIVLNNEARFVKFFNEAQAITTRYHMFELLPGLGKKTMWAIINERKKGEFTSFTNIDERAGIKHPEKLIAKRIETDLAEPDQKYRLFVPR